MKYYEVAQWYKSQHPIMFTVLTLAIIAIVLMVYEAGKLEEEDIIEDEDETI